MWWILFVSFLVFHNGATQIMKKDILTTAYDVVGIFEKATVEQRLAFSSSCESPLNASLIILSRNDSYSVWRELCKKKEVMPIAVFGPQNAISDGAVREQCALAQIPHLQATWQPYDPNLERIDENEEDTEEEDFAPPDLKEDEEQKSDVEEVEKEVEEPVYKTITINFYPDSDDIAMAHIQLLQLHGWTKFAAFYEDDYGLLRIQKILAEHSTEHSILVRKLDPNGQNNQIFKELIDYKTDRILLDCHADRIMDYMNLAQEMKIIDHYHHFIFVSLDASRHATKLLTLPCNTTWLSMTEYDKLNDTQNPLASKIPNWIPSRGHPPVAAVQLESLLISDMTQHLTISVRELQAEAEDFAVPSNSICQTETEPWEYGAALQNKILSIKKSQGITGKIQFDETGKRVNYTLYVNEIYMNHRSTIAEWNADKPNEITELNIGTQKNTTVSSNVKFKIISRRAKPYFFERVPCDRDNCTEREKEKYEGFVVDLVYNMFEVMNHMLETSYTFEFLDEVDKKYGEYDNITKKWTGLIGDLLEKKADLAVCDLTITEERKKVVDFSVPFMTLGISILYTADHEVDPDLFSFMYPYNLEVWMYTATAYCLVSLVLFVCARISPADWENPQPCDKDPEELENIWNFKNCTWLTMGSIMTQGCDILPKALGSRWVCAMWWFFAVIVCQTYIAQLSASMTTALENEPINTVDDLAKQTKILYGAIDGGSTLNFFKNSNDKMYQSMYANMMSHKAVLVQSNDEGEKRVIKAKNKYAFFMESTTIEYKMKRNCELKKIGGLLDSKDYGIAMPANSPFRSDINRAILQMKEKTTLDKLKDKWWNQMYDAKPCPKKDAKDVEGDLEMKHLMGAFVVLGGGMFICLFITAAEFMDEIRNIVVREQVTHKEAFIKELKASLNFFQLQKPVLRNPSRAPSVISDKSHLEEKQEKRAQALQNFMDLEKMPQ